MPDIENNLKVSPMSQHGWSTQCLLNWLKIKQKEGHRFPSSAEELENDLNHSALFKRMLSGLDPLGTPPPTSMNQPWYELAEKGEGYPKEVYVASQSQVAALGYDALVIDNFPWRIVEKVSDSEYLITYGSGVDTWRAAVVGIQDNIKEDLKDGRIDPGFSSMVYRWRVDKISDQK